MRNPLKSLLFFATVVLLVLAARPLLGGRPQEAAPTPAAEATKAHGKLTPEQLAKGKKIYAVDCVLCHGETGDGKTDIAKSMNANPGDWTEGKTLASKQDQDLFNVIRKGKGVMPPEGEGRADDATVWAIIHTIRAMAK